MSRYDREEVMTLAVALGHAEILKAGLPMSANKNQIKDLAAKLFDNAEAILDERDRRYGPKDF